jgi:hypothetical protein
MDATSSEATLAEEYEAQLASHQAKQNGLPQPRDAKTSLGHQRHPTQDGGLQLSSSESFAFYLLIVYQ